MLLAIDTSGNQTSVALVATGQSTLKNPDLKSHNTQVNSHSASLALTVSELLSKNNISTEQLSGIILGAGPGSFTGLRIGFAFAKGLALTFSLPIFTFSSLHAAAWHFRNKSKLILAIDDARRDEYFAASFVMNGENLDILMADKIISEHELQSWSSENSNGLIVSANQTLLDKFPKLEIATNLAVSLGQLAQSAHSNIQFRSMPAAQSNYLSEIAKINPTYVRAVSARSIIERAQIKA